MPRRILAPIAALLVATCAACSAVHELPRPRMGACLQADSSAWARRAALTLVTQPLREGPLFDVDGEGRDAPLGAIVPPQGAEVVMSYPDPLRFAGAPAGFARLAEVSYLYDDALLVLFRTAVGDAAGARRILDALVVLQRSDGAWGFSIRPSDGFYNRGYVRSGVVAFIVYAFAKYALVFGDARYRAVAGRGAAFLIAQRAPATGLVLAGFGAWDEAGATFSPGYVADFAATEHQIDAFFALAALGAVDPDGPWREAARGLDRSLTGVLSIASEGRLAQGWSPRGLDRGSALDASGTWAALEHLAQGRRTEARAALAWVRDRHAITVAGWPGLRPFADGPPPTWFVEGSVGLAMAASRLGDPAATRLVDELAILACAGGVPLVASPRWEPDFPLTPAAAPTLWFLFAVREVTGMSPPFLWIEGA